MNAAQRVQSAATYKPIYQQRGEVDLSCDQAAPATKMRLSALPLVLLRVVAELAIDSKWTKNKSKHFWKGERVFLSGSGGAGSFALVCKLFRSLSSSLVWRAHPEKFGVFAWEPKVRLLHKIKAKSIEVLVRYDTVQDDVNVFQALLLGTTANCKDVCPTLAEITFSPTLEGIEASKFAKVKKQIYSDVSTQNPEIERRYELEMISRAKSLTDIDLFYCTHPRASWSILALGATNPGFKLTCHQLPIPASMAGVDTFCLSQILEVGRAGIKALKSSTIKGFEMDLFCCEGCAIGSLFDNSHFAMLPPTLESFSIHGGTHFKLPAKFPATLKELSLSGVRFPSDSLSGRFAKQSLTKLKLQLGFCGTEDSPDYSHASFSVTGLPDSLEHFEIDETPLSGSFSPASQLKTLVMEVSLEKPLSLAVLPPSLEVLHIKCTRNRNYSMTTREWLPNVAQPPLTGSLARLPALRVVESSDQLLLDHLKATAAPAPGVAFKLIVDAARG